MTIDLNTEDGKNLVKELAREITTYPKWVDEKTAGGLLKGNMNNGFCPKTMRKTYRPLIKHRQLPTGEFVYHYPAIMKYLEAL